MNVKVVNMDIELGPWTKNEVIALLLNLEMMLNNEHISAQESLASSITWSICQTSEEDIIRIPFRAGNSIITGSVYQSFNSF